jgi:long-chain acyl-CoA synthetase
MADIDRRFLGIREILMLQQTDIISPKTARTLAGLFQERVRRTPHDCAYQHYNDAGQRFEKISWKEIENQVSRWQAALEQEQLHAGDRVAVMLRNCPEWVAFDLAALGLGLVTVPLFVNDRKDNASYILAATSCRLILLEDAAQWQSICATNDCLTGINRIIVLQDFISLNDGAAVRDPRITCLQKWLPETTGAYQIREMESDALATIVYTSGTTGQPKGVMLSHANLLENAFACLKREPIYPDDLFLSFLPLSHTFERTVGYYIPMMAGACVAHCRSVEKLAEDLQLVRPTILISVPRIYERIHGKIAASLEQKGVLTRRLFHLAVYAGWRRFQYQQGRSKWTPLLLLWPLLNKIIASRLAARFGGRLRLSISGGAALAFPITQFFIGLGLNLLQGYGLTEASPVIAFNSIKDNSPETVGRLLPGMEMEIAADGELKVRGRNIMLGYWRNNDATRAAIDENGYLHTGDVAKVDDREHIHIAGRIKEIIVLSNGEKIPPGDMELAIAMNPLFDQAMVVGEGRPYLAALTVLNRARWEKLAAHQGIAADQQDYLNTAAVEHILLNEIAVMIHAFPGYAKIRRVCATMDPWTVQDGLITSTLKLRRQEILKKYEKQIEALFDGHRSFNDSYTGEMPSK